MESKNFFKISIVHGACTIYRPRPQRVKAPGRGGVINGQLKTLGKSSNVPLFEAIVLHVLVKFINPNSFIFNKL